MPIKTNCRVCGGGYPEKPKEPKTAEQIEKELTELSDEAYKFTIREVFTVAKTHGYTIRKDEDCTKCKANIRQQVKTEIGEYLCCLIGNTMLEDKEAGKLLGEQLTPLLKFLKPLSNNTKEVNDS